MEEQIKQPTISQDIIAQEEIAIIGNMTSLEKLKRINTQNTNAPTHTPQSFQEQFYFQTGGLLWIYMNGVWVQVGASNYKTGHGTSGAQGTTTSINCGFSPKIVMVKARPNSGSSGEISDGFKDASGEHSIIFQYWNTTPATPRLETGTQNTNNRIIYLYNSSSGIYTVATCTITATGFNLYWDQTDYGTAYYQFIAI